MIHPCPHLSQFPSIRHAFFERNPNILTTEREQAMKQMTEKPVPLVTLKQIHGNHVVTVNEQTNDGLEGDGLVTKTKNLALGIKTADCGPILFCDPTTKVIGACHAGWRGAHAGILQNTIKAMESLGAERSNISATLGPTIWQENYEVGPEFPDIISEPYEKFFYPSEKDGHHYFNLPKYILTQLERERIQRVNDIKRNTFTGNFSSRRRFLSEKTGKFKSDNLSAIAII